MEGTLNSSHSTPYRGQGHLLLDQAAPSPSQPGLEQKLRDVALGDMVCGGMGSITLTAGLDGLRGLFQP